MPRVRLSAGIVVVVLTLGIVACGGEADGAGLKQPRLERVDSFAFALGSGDLRGGPAAVADRYGPYGLAVVDGEEATRAEVRAMRATGTIVLGYLSVGTIEPYRSWYEQLKPYRLPTKFEEFGEYYARVNAPGYRRAIVRRIAPPILRKGFSGLFLDNTDMIETHPRQGPGMRKVVRALSRRVHRAGGRLLFSQNGEGVIGQMLRYYDGWNREDVTSTYDFDSGEYRRVPRRDRRAAIDALRRFRERGLLTLATDYAAAGDSATTQEAVRNACSVGALPFVSNIGLTRVPAQPFTCP
ncbi:MAG: endo alpha-1,4 polygalactosaminidase [Actinomycetota bacterium]